MNFFDQPPHEEVPTALFVVAFAAFFGFRFLSYLFAGAALKRAFHGSDASAFGVAFARVIIGLLGGYAYTHVMTRLPLPGQANMLLHLSILFASLFVLRVIEWRVVIAIFFQSAAESKRVWFCSILGAFYSHFLDVPAYLFMLFVLKSFFFVDSWMAWS